MWNFTKKYFITVEVWDFPNESSLADETRLSSWVQSNPLEFKLTKEGTFRPWGSGEGSPLHFLASCKEDVCQGQHPLVGACLLPSERFPNLPAAAPPQLWILAHWNWYNKGMAWTNKWEHPVDTCHLAIAPERAEDGLRSRNCLHSKPRIGWVGSEDQK